MTDKRAVAFLDILGFRQMIESVPLPELVKQYENVVLHARALLRPFKLKTAAPSLFPNHPAGELYCMSHIFSDSIILIANDEGDESCFKLLTYTWRLVQSLLAMKMPVRGAVCFDEMYANPANNTFLGKALSRAYELEQKQDWIGVAINDCVKERYPVLFKIASLANGNLLACLFRLHAVPMKDGTTPLMHTINWRYNYVVHDGTKSLFPSAKSPGEQVKIDNALAYAKEVVDSGFIYPLDHDKCPVEVRTMFVGPKEPPFPHGDKY